MSPDPNTPIRPFRWDLARGDRVGTLLDDLGRPQLWFAEELVECAEKVIARSADGDLHFVGRSPDSMYDLLSGALAHTAWSTRLRLLPLSMFSSSADRLSPDELTQIRVNLAADGLSPHDLARRTRPVVFVDFVHEGGTFEDIFTLLRTWTAEDGAQWDVIRLKLRFVGITRRKHTSPNTWRWQQQAEWPAQLPSSAIVNVSIDARLWSYFADQQEKATISFRPQRWLDETVLEPARDDTRRKGLALAVALFEHGRRKATREALAREIANEPTFSASWLRSLALEIRRGSR
jgi:hypothetical protein